jgi:hypothetical protein
MRSLALLIVCAVGSAGISYAQTPVEIDDLRAPTAPAFALLDVTPASIERPENPKSFTMNLINTVSRSRGLPQNYALEVAPYWLTYHPQLTFAKYQSPGLMSALHTLALSVATTPLEDPANASADPVGTRLGLGVRTNLISGRFDPRLTALVDQLANAQGRVLDALRDVPTAEDDVKRAEAAVSAAEAAGQPTANAEKSLETARARLAALQEAESAAEADAMTTSLEIQALDAQRLGLIVTLAAGKTWGFLSDDFRQRQNGRWGVWVTPAYRFRACTTVSSECSAVLDAIAVVRLLREPGDTTSWDVGGRLLWQPTKELKLSAEVLRRKPDEDVTGAASSNRTTAMLEYRIRNDLALYGSFGRDFRKDTGRQPLVSLMGLNVGLGRKPAVLPVTDPQ